MRKGENGNEKEKKKKEERERGGNFDLKMIHLNLIINDNMLKNDFLDSYGY